MEPEEEREAVGENRRVQTEDGSTASTRIARRGLFCRNRCNRVYLLGAATPQETETTAHIPHSSETDGSQQLRYMLYVVMSGTKKVGF